jgi:prophage antirepressor-like protein
MEIVKAFTDNKLHTEIVIKGTINDPLFRASDIGEILEMGNIRTSIQLFNESEKCVYAMETSTGPKQVTFLTEKGLYKILFKSRKPIAEKFQNWVCEIIKEIRLTGIYDLQKEIEKKNKELTIKNKETEYKLIRQKELDKEKFLLKEYDNAGNMIYIIKVKSYDNGTYILKIGESRKGIQNRYAEHKNKYDECLLLDCFSVDKSKDFESFIHHNSTISHNKVKNLIGHEKENELFLIGGNLTYQIVIKFIDDNINNFNYRVCELLMENELLKTKLDAIPQPNMNNELLAELIKTNKLLSDRLASLEHSNKEILNKLNNHETKVVTGFHQPNATVGPRLQKINPETLELIKVYETVTELMNENKNIKRPSIMKSIQENTIYCGFRWMVVERTLDPNNVNNIQPTKKTKIQSLGYIAKLNKEKTEILNVYLDRKTAAQCNGYQSSSALDNPVKKGTLTNGHYYILYDQFNQVNEELIKSFETIYGEPLLYNNGIGQYDVNTNQLTKEFGCKYDCIKELKMSDKTLAKSLKNNIPYNNYYYRELGAKLFVCSSL